MNTKQIKRYSLSQQVADQLETQIANGVYSVGEKIPTETELSEMYDVSRNTLREAIQSLTSVGILEVRQGNGTYVRATNRFHAHMKKEYEKVSFENILEVRNALEITIAQLAAKRRTEEDLADIHKELLLRQHNSASSNKKNESDINFHLAIAKACHNDILINMYISVSSYLEDHISKRQAATILKPEHIDKLHGDLYQAIAAQDEEWAHTCVQNILKI